MPARTAIGCPECGGVKTIPSTLGGRFRTCSACGKLFTVPEGTDVDGLVSIDGSADAPDYTEVMVGWRAWRLPKDGPMLLQSATHGGTFWTPREPTYAECAKHPGHEVPEANCSCGLYSAKTRDHLLNMGYNAYDPDTGTFSIVGQVSLWGKVIEGNQGWRSEVGYPRELYVPYEAWRLAKPLHEAYGCSVKLDNILR